MSYVSQLLFFSLMFLCINLLLLAHYSSIRFFISSLLLLKKFLYVRNMYVHEWLRSNIMHLHKWFYALFAYAADNADAYAHSVVFYAHIRGLLADFIRICDRFWTYRCDDRLKFLTIRGNPSLHIYYLLNSFPSKKEILCPL